MRIHCLKLERFGHFADGEPDFGSAGDGKDFHIIYGPNGKTTTMEAVLRLFYGFPLREDDAFKQPRVRRVAEGFRSSQDDHSASRPAGLGNLVREWCEAAGL